MSSYLAVTRPVSGCCMWNTEDWILWEIRFAHFLLGNGRNYFFEVHEVGSGEMAQIFWGTCVRHRCRTPGWPAHTANQFVGSCGHTQWPQWKRDKNKNKNKTNNNNKNNKKKKNDNNNNNTLRNNNNNNTIWGGSVLTGEEPPPHSGELKHALPQAGGPTQSQQSRHVVRTPHLHGAPTTEETVKLWY